MTTVREILVDWTTISGAGKVSVFNFTNLVAVASQRVTLKSFLTDADGICAQATSWSIRTSGREMDATTGALTGAWVDPTVSIGTGGAIETSAPDSTQALVRWKTGVIVGTRFLQGRTYIPGLAVSTSVAGNLNSGAITTLTTAAAAFAAATNEFGIWRRPIHDPNDGSLVRAGQFAEVTAGVAWNEFAVLRRRRG